MAYDKKESVPAGPRPRQNQGNKRKKWQNCVCNQIIEPLMYEKPESLDELIEIITIAQSKNCKVKAVGSGHSFSDIVQTSDFLIDCHSLCNIIPLDKSLLHHNDHLAKNGYDAELLVHVENGITVKNLNNYLDENKLALTNMGAFDGQTLAGVISTSTHGSGVGLGPVAASVAALIVVGERATVYRIEPANGITDPTKYKEAFPNNKLIQDDEYFNALLVSMGCMGVIYSVVLKVMKHYYLQEERHGDKGETFWEDVKTGDNIEKLLAANRHLEIWINPYAIEGKHTCLITKRNIFTGDISSLPKGALRRKWFAEHILLKFTKLPTLIFRWLYKKTPALIKGSLNAVLDYDGYVDKSYHVLNLGNANFVKGYSGEYAVSLKDNLHVKAIDTILALAKENMEIGDVYHTAPVSMRFVKKCDAHLSMMNGEDKCMIEVPLLVGTTGRFQILDKIEHELSKVGKIRPHWGQYHNLGKDTIRDLYPDLDRWLAVYRQMNTTGIFNNTFTDRCGFK